MALEMDEDYAKFEKSFTNIKPEGDQVERIERIREDYKAVLALIIDSVERSPERTLALRALENSLMYAVKAVVLEGV
jgi:hypothetical protein